MSDPSLSLQRAVFDALRGDPAVAALVGSRIYDQPPAGAAFP